MKAELHLPMFCCSWHVYTLSGGTSSQLEAAGAGAGAAGGEAADGHRLQVAAQ